VVFLTDASGVPLVLDRAPRRIVCLIPSTSEILCHLGMADALVGVTAYCVEPREVMRGKPKVGGEKNPDLEKIRSLAPDLVVANVEENVRGHVEALRAWGIPVWVTYPRTIRAMVRLIRELGEVTGTSARAAPLADELDATYREVSARTEQRARVPVFYPIWRSPYMTIGPDTYIHDVLTVCGGENVFGDCPERYPAITLDDMAARRPEVIILPDEPFRFRRAHVADFTPYPDVPAVRDGRIHLMDGKLFAWHGPRLREALEIVPRIFDAARSSRPG
jgi:ABC-type Fe3+-hydroxamate transport system substrate-binding protein